MEIYENVILVPFVLVAVLAQLQLSKPGENIVLHVNESYNVTCEGNGEKVWKNQNGKTINSFSFGSSVYVKNNGTNALDLYFNKIQKEHKGYYNCSMVPKRSRYSKGFKLIVIKPVIFLNTPFGTLIRNEGENISLDCLTDGEPPPEISWYFKDIQIEEYSTDINYKVHSDGHSLTIMNASGKNSGIYTCRAFQKMLQTRNAEQLYIVKVTHKPMTDFEVRYEHYGFRNESVNITCKVFAYPEAYFIWYKDDEPIDPKKFGVKIYNTENVSILEVVLKEDKNVLGTYRCDSANSLGLNSQKFELKIIEKPETPQLLKHNLTSTSIVVSVQPHPTLYDFIYRIDYTEYFYCNYDEKWKRSSTLNCSNEPNMPNINKIYCKIENLKPKMKYTARAMIINDGGSGDFSNELVFVTNATNTNQKSSSTMCIPIILIYVIFLVKSIRSY